jgi:hypothetical protein
MKIYKLFSTLLTIIVIACLFGLQASATESTYQYSQFYTTTSGSVPSNAISASQQIEISGNTPSHVYLGEQMQSVSYTQYQSTPSYTGGNFLWIKGATAWTQYAVVPQGATVSLLAITSAGGSGSFTSDGQIYSNSYVLYPNSQLTFYAGTIGRHSLSFALNGWASNQVVIDVVAATSYAQPSYYPYYWNYPWSIYQSYYEPFNPQRDNQNDRDPGKKPSAKSNDNHGGNPEGNTSAKPGENPERDPIVEHRIAIKDGETQTSGNPGGDTNTGKGPSNAPSTIPANPSTSVPSTNEPSTKPSEEHGAEIRGKETQTNGNSGGDYNKCDTDYHLQNGKCVPDRSD